MTDAERRVQTAAPREGRRARSLPSLKLSLKLSLETQRMQAGAVDTRAFPAGCPLNLITAVRAYNQIIAVRAWR